VSVSKKPVRRASRLAWFELDDVEPGEHVVALGVDDRPAEEGAVRGGARVWW
jgi:hypothetical protein